MRQLLLLSLLVAAALCLSEDQAQTEGGLVRGIVSDGYRAFKVLYYNKLLFKLL